MKCLIVRPPFAEYIVNGIKTIEYRSRKTHIRGRIGIIESGTSTIIGDVELFGCNYNPDISLWEWKIEGARKYVNPIPIIRKKGTVVWQDVDYDYERGQSALHLFGIPDSGRTNLTSTEWSYNDKNGKTFFIYSHYDGKIIEETLSALQNL